MKADKSNIGLKPLFLQLFFHGQRQLKNMATQSHPLYVQVSTARNSNSKISPKTTTIFFPSSTPNSREFLTKKQKTPHSRSILSNYVKQSIIVKILRQAFKILKNLPINSIGFIVNMFSLSNIIPRCGPNQIKGIRSLLARQWHKEVEGIPVAWTRPEIGWTKLNFDGSSRGNKAPGRGSIGGVLRDHEAQFLLGYAEPIGRANSTMAELSALVKGLELVIENGWRDVWVEGDAENLVQIIAENRQIKCMEARSRFRYINSMMLDLDNFKVSHVYREGNRVAHRFASIGHRFKKLEIWREIPPLETLEMMRQDAEGKITFRKRTT